VGARELSVAEQAALATTTLVVSVPNLVNAKVIVLCAYRYSGGVSPCWVPPTSLPAPPMLIRPVPFHSSPLAASAVAAAAAGTITAAAAAASPILLRM
jgi:hypothetical protein